MLPRDISEAFSQVGLRQGSSAMHKPDLTGRKRKGLSDDDGFSAPVGGKRRRVRKYSRDAMQGSSTLFGQWLLAMEEEEDNGMEVDVGEDLPIFWN